MGWGGNAHQGYIFCGEMKIPVSRNRLMYVNAINKFSTFNVAVILVIGKIKTKMDGLIVTAIQVDGPNLSLNATALLLNLSRQPTLRPKLTF